MTRERHQCRRAVQVVGVGDAKRSVDERSGRRHRLGGAGDRPLDDWHDQEVRRPKRADVVEQLFWISSRTMRMTPPKPAARASRAVKSMRASPSRPNRSKLFQAPEPTTVTGCEQDELHG